MPASQGMAELPMLRFYLPMNVLLRFLETIAPDFLAELAALQVAVLEMDAADAARRAGLVGVP